MNLKIKTGYKVDADDWVIDKNSIASKEKLSLVKDIIEETPIILEHWIYRGSRSPDRLIIEDFEDYVEYLEEKTRAGDSIYLWKFSDLCKDENIFIQAKCPDENNMTPKKGAY